MASFSSTSFSTSAFSVDAFDFDIGPIPPPTPPRAGGDGVGMPGRTSYFDEQRKRIERENREELELIQVLTEFLGHQ